MKDYLLVDTIITERGKWELWEDEKYGDEVEAIVTLNGEKIGSTYDFLETYIKEYEEI